MPPISNRAHDLQRALTLHKAGQVAAAIPLYQALLVRDTRDFDAHLYLGMALVQQQDFTQAVFHLHAAVTLNAGSALAQNNYAVALLSLGRVAEAIDALYAATRLKPDFVDAWIKLAHALHRDQRFQAAVDAFVRALALRPDDIAVRINLGHALFDLKRYDDAAAAYQRALQDAPCQPDAVEGLIKSLRSAGRSAEALPVCVRVVQSGAPTPACAMACHRILAASDHEELAERALSQALALDPAYGPALIERGHTLRRQKKFPAAIDAYASAAATCGDNPDLFFYWGMLLYDLGRYDAAAEVYTHLLTLTPDNGAVYQARAEALRRLDRAEDALADYDRAEALLPNDLSLAIAAVHARMKVCDWRSYDKIPELLTRLRADSKAALLPFPLVALPATAQDQRLCAERYVARRFDAAAQTWALPDYGHDKIRITYVSADFHQHATLVLMAGMFEAHDKTRFEVTAISLGRDDGSSLRQRVKAAVDHFIDAQRLSDEEIVAQLRDMQYDIIVDLKGFTMDARPGIFVERHAPVQVAYLGYPATSALPNIDYFIADHISVTPEIARSFTEQMVYLPASYQINDDQRTLPEAPPVRADLGLPEGAFVFCSFNNSYKFTPDVFAVWMRILSQASGSVLWLLADSDLTMRNLRNAAEAQGIDADRLIFAPKTGLEAHVTRLAAADLFLDSLPCNAHTTASDALWAGLPVLTCPGQTFAGRVAASLLSAVNMPELIAENMAAYEARAVALAQDRAAYQAVRTKLAQMRTTAPLFDTRRTTRAIERAYEMMIQRMRSGLPPAPIDITENA